MSYDRETLETMPDEDLETNIAWHLTGSLRHGRLNLVDQSAVDLLTAEKERRRENND